MSAKPSANRTACKLRLQVPSALRAPGAGYFKRLGDNRREFEMDTPRQFNTFQEMVDVLAPNTPHALVLDWWRRLERAVDYYFVAYFGRIRPKPREYRAVFSADSRIGSVAASQIDKLRRRRNEIAHGSSQSLSSVEAAAFAESAWRLAWMIGSAVPNDRALESGAALVV